MGGVYFVIVDENGNIKPMQKLIHCKDCKYCFAEGFIHERNVCDLHPEIQIPNDYWFCADGKKE